MLLPAGIESVRQERGTSADLGTRQCDRFSWYSLAPDDKFRSALRESFAVLKDHRAAGAIPNNVDCATLRPNFRAYADGGFVVGHWQHVTRS
jgi:hypothetical protein